MNKLAKKLFVFLIALSLIASSAVALAADIAPPLTTQTGNLIIHKYGRPNTTVDTSSPGDGTELGTPPAGKPLDGIAFKAYEVTPLTVTGGYLYPSSPVDFTTIDLVAMTLTQGANVFPLTYVGEETTAGGGTATFADLNGIFLVIEQEDTTGQVASPVAPFLVAVPMTNPAGSGFLQDVHVYPKDEQLTLTKAVVNTDSYNVGDTVTYTLDADLPVDIAAALSYAVTDQLDKALDFVSVSKVVAATGKDASGNLTGTVTLTEGTEYTVTPSAATAAGPLVTVDFDQTKLDGYFYVQITLNTKLNATAAVRTNYTVGNTAQIELTNEYGDDVTIDSNNNIPVDIHTAAIDITKVDALNPATKLDGAQFKIASSTANADNQHYIRIDSVGNIYDYDPADVAKTGPYYTAAGIKDYVVTTVRGGVASFLGLKDYDGFVNAEDPSLTAFMIYYLVETQAPTGYNLVPGYITVTFDASTSTGVNPTHTASVTVTNNQGFTLPKTGGMGTVLFTVGGVALVGIAVLLLVSTKKKKEDSAE